MTNAMHNFFLFRILLRQHHSKVMQQYAQATDRKIKTEIDKALNLMR